MPSLTHLPDELLLQVANYISPHDRPCGKDILRLCFVNRMLCRISQEAIYTHPALRDKTSQGGDRAADVPRLALLARTLLERPDLAWMVQRLDLIVMYPRYTCAQQIDLCNLAQGKLKPGHLNDRWAGLLDLGNEVACAGLILTVSPNLRYLELQLYRNGFGDWTTQQFTKTRFNPAQLFSSLAITHWQELSGFVNLTSLRLSRFPTASTFSLPNLREIRFTLMSLTCGDLALLPKSSILSSITSLSVDTSIGFLKSPSIYGIDDRIGFLNQLVPRFPRLNTLVFHLAISEQHWRGGDDHVHESSYADLFRHIASDKIETLIINISQIDARARREDGINERYILGITSKIESLTQFSNLRRIVAPKEALLGKSSACELPDSVQNIEVQYVEKHATVQEEPFDESTALDLIKSASPLPHLMNFSISWSKR